MDTRTRSGRAPMLISTTALVVAIGGVGGPAVAAAINADTVDRKHAVGAAATPAQRAGKLVATNTAGNLPANLIPKALNADKLDGIDSGAFSAKSSLSSPGTVNAGQNPVDWTKLKGVPAGLADGQDGGDGIFGSTQLIDSVTAGGSDLWTTHSWPTTWNVHWMAYPTEANGARLATDVVIQNENGLLTYVITVSNTNGIATPYQLVYVAVPR